MSEKLYKVIVGGGMALVASTAVAAMSCGSDDSGGSSVPHEGPDTSAVEAPADTEAETATPDADAEADAETGD